MADFTVQDLLCFNGTALIETIKEKAGQFELPDSADKKPQKGKIIAISNTDDISDFGSVFKCPAKVGQVVWYKNWSSEVFDIGGKDYINVQFRHIIMGKKE